MAGNPKASEPDGRQVAYYSALLSAWIQTRMERDKALITLSSAGVGLLLTLASTVGATTWEALGLYFLGFLGFLVTIFSCLAIYQRNARHIERVVRGQFADSLTLEAFDRLSFYAFFLGTMAVVGLGVTSAVSAMVAKGVIR